MTSPATVLLAHSLPHVVMVWRALLGPHIGRFHIRGEASTAQQMILAATALQPALIFMDAGMSGKCMADTVRQLQACVANVKLIISWQYCHDHLVQPITGLPIAYLAEDVSLPEVLTALDQLMRGRSHYCRQSERLFSPPAARKPLSEKRRRLLWCMRQSHTAKEMAMAMDVKESTVKGYVKELHALIGSHSMPALESFMKKEGMG